jgi:hypothetical protein
MLCQRFGDHSFEAAAPKLWNSLPTILRDNDDILSFRKGLKTWLFNIGRPGFLTSDSEKALEQ